MLACRRIDLHRHRQDQGQFVAGDALTVRLDETGNNFTQRDCRKIDQCLLALGVFQQLPHYVHARLAVEQGENGAAIEPACGLLFHDLLDAASAAPPPDPGRPCVCRLASATLLSEAAVPRVYDLPHPRQFARPASARVNHKSISGPTPAASLKLSSSY